MPVLDKIRKRYSCRAYLDKPIEAEKLDRIFEAARLAPSAKNIQDWRFVAVTDEGIRKQLAVAANEQMFLADAPVIIVACSISDYVMSSGQAISQIDVAIALEHIALAAVDEGLATCWIGAFKPAEVRKVLNIPAEVNIIDLMPIGYPSDKQHKAKREPIENIICYESWKF